MKVIPITVKEASLFVAQRHRHHKPPRGGLFAVAASKDGETICGVAIVGRPVAQMNQDGYSCEVSRVATDGTKNACSFLYARCWRVAQQLGYKRMFTYTLPEEGGASLRATNGFRCLGERGGGSWDRKSRPRVDAHPTQVKFGWVAETD